MEGERTTNSIIAEDIEIQGSVKCASNVQIDGKLNGDLNCTGNAVIGSTANIKGNLTVDSVTVHGTINGNITAKDRIEMKATAKLTGDIRAKRLTVEDGVTFVGKSEVNPSGAAGGRPAPHGEQAPSEPAATEGEEDDEDPQGGKSKGGGMFGGKR